MGNAVPVRRLTVEEYIEGELRSDIRHEYIAGEIFAMVGASKNHARIVRNLLTAIDQHLGRGPCEVLATDVKVRIEAADVFYYPDLLVMCDPTDDAKYFSTKPVLVIEVLSPHTEPLDRREKRFNYQRLPSLREYVLVAQNERCVEIYRRGESQSWSVETVTGDETAFLSSIDYRVSLSTIYSGVTEGQ